MNVSVNGETVAPKPNLNQISLHELKQICFVILYPIVQKGEIIPYFPSETEKYFRKVWSRVNVLH